jgi:hypothetical protein
MKEATIISLAVSALTVILAPIIALWVTGRVQAQTERRKDKLHILAILLSNRHQILSQEWTRSLNLIDVVFADDVDVRNSWSRYFSALSDTNLNQISGISVRNGLRQDLISEIIKCLGLSKKITNSDILRSYQPTFFARADVLAMMELDIREAEALKKAHELGLKQWEAPAPPA